MKTFYLILLIFLLMSCSDILQEKPYSIATETFYTTTVEIESAVYSTYDPLRGGVFGRNYLTLNLSQVDYGVGRGSYASISQFQGLDATNVGRTDAMWNSFYLSIRNANIVIKNAPHAVDNGVDISKVNPLIAEAKFIRAYDYFQLLVNWGGVPLRTEETMSVIELPRSTMDDVYKLVISDLEFAETNLPDKPAMAGRPSKWTAKTVLADVYLNLSRWSDSKNKALEVITANKYQLINVYVPNDYYKIFGYDVVTSSEEIFYIKYNGLNSNGWNTMFHYPSDGYDGGAGSYGNYTDSVTNKLIRDWDYKDLRKSFNLYNWNIGFGKTTMLYKKFIEPNKTLGLSCDYPVYRYADLLLIYAEADCRANNGPTSDGIEKLNMLHRRGYGKNPNIVSTLDYKVSDYTEDTFIDLVLKERMYELFSEHKRWYELKRTGKLKQAILDVFGLTVADKQLLWPIPISEFYYNKAIDGVKDQNPGY